jgi:hypothetical protein
MLKITFWWTTFGNQKKVCWNILQGVFILNKTYLEYVKASKTYFSFFLNGSFGHLPWELGLIRERLQERTRNDYAAKYCLYDLCGK